MTEQEELEKRIGELLATETDPWTLSEQLFSDAGLFSKLGKTEAERRAIIQTPLFKQALDRFHDLRDREADSLSLPTVRH